ncbi:MAG: glutaredoxin 3 [Alphaproteobacteria bacterium]|nr:glutaredoxin 3 [Alphaproteobacteria bacterium]NCQ87635.1 glutaredoxin 3 [Alphaproteobacteria bacterium]NCT05856.1 glutaredoxin 3 [Alphaproteobacteria bacterium]
MSAAKSQQAKVEVYYWTTCPYCTRALALLDKKKVKYTGYDITGDEPARAKMVQRTGGPKSVPQIFVNDVLIGGCDDLHALEAKGQLDGMLNV